MRGACIQCWREREIVREAKLPAGGVLMDRPALMLLLERDQGLGRFELFGLAELLRLGGFLAGFLGRHGEPPSEMRRAGRTPRIMHLFRNRLHNFLHVPQKCGCRQTCEPS
jgi:hypothetical protein